MPTADEGKRGNDRTIRECGDRSLPQTDVTSQRFSHTGTHTILLHPTVKEVVSRGDDYSRTVEYKHRDHPRFPILGNAPPHLLFRGGCPRVAFDGAQHVISPLSTANAVRPLSFDHRIANDLDFLKHIHVLSFSCSCPLIVPHRFPSLKSCPHQSLF